MIPVDTEFFSSPYYFLMRDKGNKYSLYFSVENTLTEARKKDEVIHFSKEKGEKVKKHLKRSMPIGKWGFVMEKTECKKPIIIEITTTL